MRFAHVAAITSPSVIFRAPRTLPKTVVFASLPPQQSAGEGDI